MLLWLCWLAPSNLVSWDEDIEKCSIYIIDISYGYSKDIRRPKNNFCDYQTLPSHSNPPPQLLSFYLFPAIACQVTEWTHSPVNILLVTPLASHLPWVTVSYLYPTIACQVTESQSVSPGNILIVTPLVVSVKGGRKTFNKYKFIHDLSVYLMTLTLDDLKMSNQGHTAFKWL